MGFRWVKLRRVHGQQPSVVQVEAAGHERARPIERTVRIQYGDHAAALDGEGQGWEYRVMTPGRPLLEMAQTSRMPELGPYPTHRQQETTQSRKFPLEDLEHFSGGRGRGAGHCDNGQWESHNLCCNHKASCGHMRFLVV